MRFAENASKARGDVRSGNRPDQRLRWTGIGVLLLLVAGLSWFVWSYVHKKIALVTPRHVTHTTTAADGGYLGNAVTSGQPGLERVFAWLTPL